MASCSEVGCANKLLSLCVGILVCGRCALSVSTVMDPAVATSAAAAPTTAAAAAAGSSFEPTESVVLSKDVVLLRGMAPALQQELCDALRACPTFFECNNEKTRHIDMLHLGWHELRGKLRLVAPIPPLYARIAREAQALVAERHSMLRTLPTIAADVAVVNAYKREARLGMHVDRRSMLHPGIPVVAISLGESAEFVFKTSWKQRAATQRVILRSGDVLVFGGKARGIVHGMDRLVAGSAPAGLELGAQASWRRLCITLRQS